MAENEDTSKISEEQLQQYRDDDSTTVLIDGDGNVEVRKGGEVIERGRIDE